MKELNINQLNEEIYPEKKIDEISKIEEIKEKISGWSNSIPHHDLQNFGNLIKINEITEKPCFVINLKTFYEKRTLRNGERPYRGEEIPLKKITRENAEIWSYLSIPSNNFYEESANILIKDSQKILECPECRAKGEVRCEPCKGHGKITCTTCNGSREVTCKTCNGLGKTKCGYCYGKGSEHCWTCSGKGVLSNGSRCNSCHGKGQKICTRCQHGYNPCNCHHGRVFCPLCKGAGTLTCTKCQGVGWVLCYRCDGKGKVIEYLYVLVDFSVQNLCVVQNHETLPGDIITGNSEFIYTNNDNNCEIVNESGVILTDIYDLEIKKDLFNEINFSLINQKSNNLLENSKMNTILGTFNKDYKILQQNISIKKINLTQIKYLHNGKEYEMWIFGKKDKIYSPINPFREIEEKYFQTAIELLKVKKYSLALTFIDKVCAMNPKLNKANVLKKEIISKIKKQYIYGGLIGGFGSGVLLSGIYSLINIEHYLPLGMPIGVIILITGIIGFSSGLIFKKIKSIKEKESKKRFLFPLLSSSIFISIIFLTTFIINFVNTAGIEKIKRELFEVKQNEFNLLSNNLFSKKNLEEQVLIDRNTYLINKSISVPENYKIKIAEWNLASRYFENQQNIIRTYKITPSKMSMGVFTRYCADLTNMLNIFTVVVEKQCNIVRENDDIQKYILKKAVFLDVLKIINFYKKSKVFKETQIVEEAINNLKTLNIWGKLLASAYKIASKQELKILTDPIFY